MPGHAAGFQPLTRYGLQFCSGDKKQLYNDFTTNTTLNIVSTVIHSVAAAFPDALFHLGGDETNVNGSCTLDNIHRFEEALQVRYI